MRYDPSIKDLICNFLSVKVDVLEIALREQLEMIDQVFIVEATVTHKGVSEALTYKMILL